MQYPPSPPSSESSVHLEPLNDNQTESPTKSTNNYHYNPHSRREIDYDIDPPEFIPPSNCNDEDDESEQEPATKPHQSSDDDDDASDSLDKLYNNNQDKNDPLDTPNMYETNNNNYYHNNNNNNYRNYRQYYHKRDAFDPNNQQIPVTPSASSGPSASSSSDTDRNNNYHHYNYHNKNNAYYKKQKQINYDSYPSPPNRTNTKTDSRYTLIPISPNRESKNYQAYVSKKTRKSPPIPRRVQANYRNNNENAAHNQSYNANVNTWQCSVCSAANNVNTAVCGKCSMIPSKTASNESSPTNIIKYNNSSKKRRRDPPKQPAKAENEYPEPAEYGHAKVILQQANAHIQQRQAYAFNPRPQPQPLVHPTTKMEYDGKPNENDIDFNGKKAAKHTAELAVNRNKDINDGGTLEKEHKIMLRMIDRIEKRQSKIDNKTAKIDASLCQLQVQKNKMFKQLQFDRSLVAAEFNRVERCMNAQFDGLTSQFVAIKTFLRRKQLRFERYHKKTEKTIWKPSIEDKKALKKELECSIREFDHEIKKIEIPSTPQLYYESDLAKRYAKFQDVVENHKPLAQLFDDNEEEEKCETVTTANEKIQKDDSDNAIDKIIFVDSVLCGAVAIAPHRVDIALSKSYAKRESVNISDVDVDVDENDAESVTSEISEMSVATSAKFDVRNNLRVMFGYDDIGAFNAKSLHILQHEIVIELKNMKAFSVIIDKSLNFYEYDKCENLKIYEGFVRVRSRNKNGWSKYKCLPFRFDEYGNKLQLPLL